MPEFLRLSNVTDSEKDLIARLQREIRNDQRHLTKLERYRDAEQRIEHIGLAVPPELRRFETVINVPGIAVREPVNRQALRAFVRADTRSDKPDPDLEHAWEHNNLASGSIMVHTDCRTYGRAFVSVSSNELEPSSPLILPEPPASIGVLVDRVHRVMRAALRVYREDDRRQRATLYLPDETLQLVSTAQGWRVEDAEGPDGQTLAGRNRHELGAVPLIMFLNRPKTGIFSGRSEMADVIGKTDAIARMLMRQEAGAESAAIPDKVVLGANEDDFVDESGEPIPTWEGYYTKYKALTSPDAKIDAWPAADLAKFSEAINNMLAWCATELGLPTRYAGHQTVQPATEGAIIADEIRLIKNVENMNLLDGDAWSWVMALHERFRTGKWPARNSIRALWHNPATPTYSQRADAVMKLRAARLLSMQGAWDELGWSEDRKKRELDYMAQEANDPVLSAFNELMGGLTGASQGDY